MKGILLKILWLTHNLYPTNKCDYASEPRTTYCGYHLIVVVTLCLLIIVSTTGVIMADIVDKTSMTKEE